MNKLLMDEHPLIILPLLAKQVGLNEAIILQQLHYWLKISTNKKEGSTWVYNTFEEWQAQFPFWSSRTIKRIIKGLESNDLIIAGNFNKLKIDRTKWYRINYKKLNSLVSQSSCQVGTMDEPTWHNGHANMAQPLPEITTETSSETSLKDNVAYAPSPLIKEVVEYLNLKTGKSYTTSSNKTISYINARSKEGYKAEDFKKVIDVKTAEWLNDSTMEMYLRPKTLFGTNFESYLNQKPKGAPLNGTTPKHHAGSNDEEWDGFSL